MDADPPAQGVKIARRITLGTSVALGGSANDSGCACAKPETDSVARAAATIAMVSLINASRSDFQFSIACHPPSPYSKA